MLGGILRSAIVCCTAFMPVPRSRCSKRAVTCTSRCRFSRLISTCPGISVIVASEPSVAVLPVPLISSVLRMESRSFPYFSGKRTRMLYERSLITTGFGAGSPCITALASNSSSCAEKPARAGSHRVNTECARRSADGIFDAVFHVDDAGNLLDRFAHGGAHWFRSAGSWSNSLITTGSGALVKSPIMSCRSCTTSISQTGSAFLILARTSAMMSSALRLRCSLQLHRRW